MNIYSYGCWNWLLYEVYFVYHVFVLNQPFSFLRKNGTIEMWCGGRLYEYQHNCKFCVNCFIVLKCTRFVTANMSLCAWQESNLTCAVGRYRNRRILSRYETYLFRKYRESNSVHVRNMCELYLKESVNSPTGSWMSERRVCCKLLTHTLGYFT